MTALYGYDGADLAKDIDPTTESISELIYRARFEFSQLDAADRIRNDVYFGDNDIARPSHINFQDVHLMVVNSSVSDIIGVMSQRPTLDVSEYSLNTKKIVKATNVENCMNALFPALEDDKDDSIWLKILEDQVRFGRAYDILEYVPTRWAKQPQLTQYKNPDGSYRIEDYDKARIRFALTARLPMQWRHLPARGCFAWFDDYGMQQFLSIEERAAVDVAQSYNRPDLLEDLYDFTTTPNMHVIFCQYWNRSYYAYWISKGYASQTWEQRAQSGLSLLTLANTIGGEIVSKGPNIYGVIPVIETKSMSSTDLNPARKYRAPIDALIPLAVYLDQLAAQKGSAIRTYCWPTPFIKTVQKELGAALQTAPIGPEGRPTPVNIVPGEILYLPQGQDVGWLVVPQEGPDIDRQIELIQKHADEQRLPSALFNGTSQANGYLYNSMMSAVMGKLSPLATNTKRAHKKRCELAFRILEIHSDDFYIYQEGSDASDAGNWVNIKPKDIMDWKARYILKVNYDDQRPYDDAQEQATAAQMTQDRGQGMGPLLSDYTVLKDYLHVADPEAEMERRRIERIERSPVVDEFLSAKASIDAGITLANIQSELNTLSPEQLRNLPPSLVQAAAQAGQPIPGTVPTPAMPGNEGAGTPATPSQAGTPTALAAPSTTGGIPGAPAAPVIPGITHPLTPPAPTPGTPPPARKGPARR